MGLAVLILGLIVLFGAHTFVTFRSARAAILRRLGRPAYLGLFSLVSFAGLALIFWGFAVYRQTGWIELWRPTELLRHVTVALVWPAAVLVTAAYIPGHIKRTLKHPMLAGVKLWAFAHLLSNGDLGGIILFGSVLGWAVYDRIALKRREAAGEVAAATFADRGWTNDIIAVALGTVLYLALGFAFHPVVIGVPAFGR